tara:strand:+ start:1062 stop:1355 length:294 start_codon:yes stop_codon:yes gene_type:complete
VRDAAATRARGVFVFVGGGGGGDERAASVRGGRRAGDAVRDVDARDGGVETVGAGGRAGERARERDDGGDAVGRRRRRRDETRERGACSLLGRRTRR